MARRHADEIQVIVQVALATRVDFGQASQYRKIF